ncbi:hypothetical protein [Streptomyces sp. MMG1121]|uniref:hypothetical protein n=1 Tax=Streptomyces sp. MMG1121 TaxID=1415544 RepID=UPI0006ADA4A6|nr:hypothetical protein [Streptomyces sp. MMG1121]KOV59263.1 hypothetical protein ADK64_34620 [Streptomyces sp. MMG1121]
MAQGTESQVRRWGRLFAALAVLRSLADPGKSLPGADAFAGKATAAQRIDALKSDPYDALLKARKQGDARWKAAAAVFHSLPGLLEQGPLAPTGTLGKDRRPDFIAGYEAQLAQFKEAFPSLLG